ncbi:MAG: restriction endonuclease [Candidatus Bathyarchaeia archaeon]
MSSRYRKGRRFEYYVTKLLRNRGFEVVRSAGSHTDFDLVALKQEFDSGYPSNGTTILLVQCKHRPASRDFERVRERSLDYNVPVALAYLSKTNKVMFSCYLCGERIVLTSLDDRCATWAPKTK